MSQSNTYYCDAVAGNDSNPGTSESLPWKSLGKINSFQFKAGDTLLLKSGSVWAGMLNPPGSGSSDKPIILSSYGGTTRPRIDGCGITGKAAVYFFNQPYWEISNLEITNDADSADDRRGILIAAGDYGIVNHIYLKNLLIHDVKGIVGQDDNAKRTAGIGIEITADGIKNTRFNDVRIEDCEIYAIENTGIYTDNLVKRSDYPGTSDWHKRKFTNMLIRNNRIHHISKNAMIIRLFENGFVEYNVCYETALKVTGNTIYSISTSGTVFQYNEGYYNRSPGADGSLYDADLRSPNTIWQYSYSHDNAHGLMWFCTDAADTGIIVRYNISQNDKGRLVAFRYDFSGASVYNNVFYIGSGLSPEIIHERSGAVQTYRYFNNIVYNNSQTARYTFANANRTIEANVFYGIHLTNEPADSKKITADPKFLNPGSGSIGLSTLDGYHIGAASPCINSGIRNFSHPQKDFYSNPLSINGAVDRGVHEYQNTSGGLKPGIKPPQMFGLTQNYPNPFNPNTRINFSVTTVQPIELSVFNFLGKAVRTLHKGIRDAGVYELEWNGTDNAGNKVSPGVYFARLSGIQGSTTIKMLLLQ